MSPSSTLDDVKVHAVDDTSAVVLPNPVDPDGFLARRSKKFNGGVAAATSSDLFKTPTAGKPQAKRWNHYLTEECASRKGCSLKLLAKNLSTPGMISLGGGLPSSDYFPFESLSFKVPQRGQFSEAETKETGKVLTMGKHDVKEGKSQFDLSIALNYGQSSGSAQMVRWITEHTELVHSPPYADWGISLSCGSTQSLEAVLRMFLNRGDYVISEEYTFATAVETIHPLGGRVLGIAMDAEGLLPDVLDSELSSWDPSAHDGARKPFILYTVPSGQNPTGATMGLQRRKDIYAVAEKHDLIILEDEPYYFLQMPPYNSAAVSTPSLIHGEFLASLVPSLLSMDTSGRVIRLDSFSKVLAPGSRVGWIVAPNQICERYQRANETSIQFPSGFSQAIFYKLLDEEWGHAGYLEWLMKLRESYAGRRQIMLHACEKFLPREICAWTPPAAGMFHWISLDHTKHPQWVNATGARGGELILEIEKEVHEEALANCVLLTPGSFFLADQSLEVKHLFFRATFAAAQEAAMTEAIRRFGEAVRKCFGLPSGEVRV